MEIINNLPKELQMKVYEYHNPHKEQYNKCIADFKKIYDYFGDSPKFVIWYEKLDDRFNRIYRLLGYGQFCYSPKNIPLYYAKNDMIQQYNWKKIEERPHGDYRGIPFCMDENGRSMDGYMYDALWKLDLDMDSDE